MANDANLHAAAAETAATKAQASNETQTEDAPQSKKNLRIGEFYRLKVASRDDLLMRELTISDGNPVQIEQNLFGYSVVTSKGFLECRSETEARFLRVFIELGVREIGVPEDDAFLEKILPELESLKQRIDRILEPYMVTLNRRLRTELRRSVYTRIAQ